MARSTDRLRQKHASRMKGPVAEFATLLSRADGVRDYLVAKRQPLAQSRAADMEATALMWLQIHPKAVNELWIAAAALYDGIVAIDDPAGPILDEISLPFATQDLVRAALPKRDSYWYIATDTGADFRPHTLPAAQGGELGRLIAQINDIALSVDAMLRIAPVLDGVLPYDWLVRSSLLVELAALLDLSIGRADEPVDRRRASLLEMCRYGRPTEAAAELQRLADSIPLETRRYIKWGRDKVGAHLDRELSIFQVHSFLARLDYLGVIRLAEHVLDWLDHLGATHLDLKMLLMGERRIGAWPIDADDDRLRIPDPSRIPGSLARLFRSIDSPYVSGVAVSSASSALAGISAGRRPAPRTKIVVKRRWDKFWDSEPLPSGRVRT